MPVHQEASVETIHYGGHTQWYKVAMCQIPQFSANNQSKSISDLENPSVSFKFIMSHHVSSSSPIFLREITGPPVVSHVGENRPPPGEPRGSAAGRCRSAPPRRPAAAPRPSAARRTNRPWRSPGSARRPRSAAAAPRTMAAEWDDGMMGESDVDVF